MTFRIALRYLFAAKSHKVVNVISLISIAGVAVATMAIVVVLSVFNGFSDLAKSHLAAIDPDVRIVPTKGKVLAGDSIAALMESMPGVATAMPVLTERALLAATGAQTPVIIKGLDPAGAAGVMNLDRLIIDGIYSPASGVTDSLAGIQLSAGVAMATGLRPSPYSVADIYMPRRLARINPANPAGAYRQRQVGVTGVFRVDQPEYDSEYVLAPIELVRELLDYHSGEASAVEIMAAHGTTPAELERTVSAMLGADYVVQGRERQQAETFRMIAVEKWVTFLMLVCILIIASFNIISTLSLMVIEKRDNMATLRALGATRRMVSSIFVTEGWLITMTGGIAGIVVGAALSLLQQYFGIVRLGADPSALTIDVYPVRLEAADVLLVLVTVCLTGIVMGQVSRLFTRKIN